MNEVKATLHIPKDWPRVQIDIYDDGIAFFTIHAYDIYGFELSIEQMENLLRITRENFKVEND